MRAPPAAPAASGMATSKSCASAPRRQARAAARAAFTLACGAAVSRTARQASAMVGRYCRRPPRPARRGAPSSGAAARRRRPSARSDNRCSARPRDGETWPGGQGARLSGGAARSCQGGLGSRLGERRPASAHRDSRCRCRRQPRRIALLPAIGLGVGRRAPAPATRVIALRPRAPGPGNRAGRSREPRSRRAGRRARRRARRAHRRPDHRRADHAPKTAAPPPVPRRRPRLRRRRRPPSPQGSSRAAASTSSAWPGTFTLRQTRATVPSRSIRKVARSIPIYLRP